MEKNIMISVIIPVYNREKTVKKAIDSVLAQTWKDMEIIVIDDGSTDKSAEVIKSIKDARIKYIYQKNAGACAARNHGLDLATGDIIAFHDSDDVWHKDKLEKQLNKLNESGADIVFCKLNEFKEDGKKVLLPMTINEGMLNPVVTVMGIGTQTLVAHSYVFKNLRFDPEFPRFQELELLYRASKSFSIYCIGEGLVDYYIGKDSISSNPEKLYNACLLMKTKHPELGKYMPQLEKDLGSCLKTAGVNAYRVGNENYKKYIYEAGKFNRTLKMKIIVMLARMNMLKVFYK